MSKTRAQTRRYAPEASKPTHPPSPARAIRASTPAPPPKPSTAAAAPKSDHDPLIRVRATEQTYQNEARQRPGDVFTIPESRFNPKCMERVNPRTPERTTSAPEALRKQHDELISERNPAKGTPLVHDETHADEDPLGARR